MELPRTLHGQLYLLAYDREHRRFDYDNRGHRDPKWLFEFALRSAMLTDLYLAGYVENNNGVAALLKSQHHDPLLNKALTLAAGRGWSEFVYRGVLTCRDVSDQLEAAGWIRGRHRKLFGLAGTSFDVYDEDMVDLLSGRVAEALRNILADRPADPGSLAVGLIAVQAQLPAISSFLRDTHHRDQLHEMTLAAIEPILGLYNAIRRHDYKHGYGWGGGGGCGGGA